jgi:mitochondrial fission protein ELM1
VTVPRIWVIPGNRPGDDAQVYALAEELRLPFETRKLRFKRGLWTVGKLNRVSPSFVERRIRERTIIPPWPDLIIMVGRRAVPIARWVQQQSGGRTRLVYVGHPRVPPETFDLIFTTRQYLTPTGAPMRLQALAMSRYRKPAEPDDEERRWLDALPRPHLLLMLGGKTRHWCMRRRYMARVAAGLAQRAERAGGSLIIARSARTSGDCLDEIERQLGSARCEWRVVRGDFPRFPVLLHDGDELFPTADSISMVSESIIAGKPVGVVPVEMNFIGRIMLGAKVDETNPKRDLRRFWDYVLGRKLAGPVDDPVASQSVNPVIGAAVEVRALLDATVGKLPI